MASHAWNDFLVCPDDTFGLSLGANEMSCPACGRTFDIRNGIAMMLPDYEDDLHKRYVDSYQKIARDDLSRPLEGQRDVRHEQFLEFIGDTSGKRVLDVGSSNGLYLEQMRADCKVALDISLPYLEAISPDAGIMRVCADAEKLPAAIGFFDVVIISGLLEHVLSPESLVARLHQVCKPSTRIIVLVPWEEDLSPYRDLPWEFTHLRTFTAFTFSQLWHQFRIVRKKGVWPRLSDPLLFRLDERLPTAVFDFLRYGYFHRELAKTEAEHRMRWHSQLPRRERRLLGFYRPTFYEFELRTYAGSNVPSTYDSLARVGDFLTRPFRRSR